MYNNTTFKAGAASNDRPNGKACSCPPRNDGNRMNLSCYYNQLTSLDLTGRSLYSYTGSDQSVSLSLVSSDGGSSYAAVNMNAETTFAAAAISYADGTLTSTDATVTNVGFTSQTGLEGKTISGTPTTAETAVFTVKAANGVTPDATRQLSITIADWLEPLPPTIMRKVTLAVQAGVTSQPAAGVHYILSGSNFAFTLTRRRPPRPRRPSVYIIYIRFLRTTLPPSGDSRRRGNVGAACRVLYCSC